LWPNFICATINKYDARLAVPCTIEILEHVKDFIAL